MQENNIERKLETGALSKPKVFGSLVFQLIMIRSLAWNSSTASSGKPEST
jgi:hypothetical protein